MIETAVASDPQNASYLDSFGWAQFKLGQLDLAEEYLLASLKMEPENPIVLEHLGDVYRKQNNIAMARQRWQKAAAVAESEAQSLRLRRKLEENQE